MELIQRARIDEFLLPIAHHIASVCRDKKLAPDAIWTYEVHFQFPRRHRALLYARKSDLPDEADFQRQCKEKNEAIFSAYCEY